jgi:hypothetical protein
VKRYLAKTRKRTGGLICLRCQGRFAGRDAYDAHLVKYADEDWCHLPEEIGLVKSAGGWHRLGAQTPTLVQGIQIDAVAL